MKKAIVYSFLLIIAISMILPFIAMFLISLTGNEHLFIEYKHINLNLTSYKNVFASIPVAKYFLNSLIVALGATLGQVLISTLAGYGFARLNFKYSNAIFFVFVLSMMIPPQVNIVPLFCLIRVNPT